MAAYRPAPVNPTRRPASARFRQPDDLARILRGVSLGLRRGAFRRQPVADRGTDLTQRGHLLRRQRVEQALPDRLDVPGGRRLEGVEAFLRQDGPRAALVGRAGLAA